MMAYSISVLKRAQADADRIFLWIAERSSRGAASWEAAYEKSLLELRHDADRYGLAPQSRALSIEIREKRFKTRRGRPYRLVFTLLGNDVRVLRVRGPGQADVTAEDIAE